MFELTAEKLRDMLSYDPETGEFFWLIKPSGPTPSGSRAGKTTNQGRRSISIKNRNYEASRLAWLHFYGEWPKNHIDHINRNPLDNRICNLRDVTCAENQRNRSSNIINGYGKGYSYHKKRRKWQAQASIDGKVKYLGLFDSEEEAKMATLAAKGVL